MQWAAVQPSPNDSADSNNIWIASSGCARSGLPLGGTSVSMLCAVTLTLARTILHRLAIAPLILSATEASQAAESASEVALASHGSRRTRAGPFARSINRIIFM